MIFNKMIAACLFLSTAAHADSFSYLAEEIDSNLINANACEQETNSTPFTRIGMSVGASISFGIHEVLDLKITPEIGFIWVKKGHEAD